MIAEARYESGETRLQPGDLLALFTDGIIEAEQGEDMYGDDRLLELLRAAAAEPNLDALGRRVMESVDGYIAGGRRTDDITLMLLRRS